MFFDIKKNVFNSLNARVIAAISALLLLISFLFYWVIHNWQNNLERALVEKTFRSHIVDISDAVASASTTNNNDAMVLRLLQRELTDTAIKRLAIVGDDDQIRYAVPNNERTTTGKHYFAQWSAWQPKPSSLWFSDVQVFFQPSQALVVQKLYLPPDRHAHPLLLAMEIDLPVMMSVVEPVSQRIAVIGALLMAFLLLVVRWILNHVVVQPLKAFSHGLIDQIETGEENKSPDLGVFSELSDVELEVARLVDRLRVRNTALIEQGEFIHNKLNELDRIIRCASLGTWDWDIESNLMRFNAERADMLGLVDDVFQCSMEGWEATLHPLDAERVKNEMHRHLCGVSSRYISEHRVRHASGQWIWVLDIGEVYARDREGNALRIAGVMVDVTERKQLEMAVQESNAHLLGIFNQPYSGIAIFDANTQKITRCNQRFADLFKTSSDQIIGREFCELARCTGKETCVANVAQHFHAAKTKGGWLNHEWEAQCLQADGHHIWLHITLSVSHQKDGSSAIMMAQSIQDRKQSELAREAEHEKLENMQARLDTMLRSMQEGVVMQTPDGRIVEFNDMAPILLGLSTDQMLGISSFDPRWKAISPDGEELSGDDHPSMVAARTGHAQFEKIMGVTNLATEEMIWLSINSQPVFDIDGNVEFTVTTFSDITQRLRYEKALKETSARLNMLMDHAPDVILAVDESQCIVFANAVTERIFGYAPGDIVGQPITVLLPPEYRKAHSRWAKKYINEDDSNSAYDMGARRMIQGLHRNGKLVDVEISLSRSVTEQGSLVTAVIRDITSRRELEAQASRLSHALEQSPIKSIIFNLQGVIEFANHACFTQGGYAQSELLDKNLFDLYSPLSDVLQLKALVDSLIHQRPWKGELTFIHGDGSTSIDRTTIAPLRDARGDVSHFISMQEDITEQISNQRELEEYRNGLEKMVIGRTIELSQAKQRAEAAALAKTSFLANMSHEIRTPMNAITGFAQLLRQEELTKRQADFVQKIVFAGDHLLHIINDILDLSKIEAGKVVLQEDEFDLTAFAKEILDMVRNRAEIKNLKVTLTVAENVPTLVKLDRMRLGQVLLNLLSNATKFTDKGEVVLDIRCPASDRLHLAVRDSGIGIDSVQQKRLFQPFEQADSSTTRRFGGTGLGLSISKNLVTLMGGEIGVQSSIGNGSTFWIELPLIAPTPIPITTHSSDTVPRVERRFHNQNIRVLLAEDDKLNQELVVILLSEQGIRPQIANNGVEALSQAQHHDFDLILMDIQMPQMDGIECAQQIRNNSRNRHTPIVALTANVFAEERQLYLQSGINDVLAKPLDTAQLETLLARYLNSHESESISSTAATPSPTRLSSSVSPQAESLITRLRESAEFDVERALKNVGDRADLLVTLCQGFVQTHQQTIATIRTQLIADQRDAAARLAHSLKGAALALGAIKLAQSAAIVDEVIRTGASYAAQQTALNTLQQHAQEVMTCLSSPSSTCLPALIALVQQSDVAAIDWFSEHENQLAQVLDAAQLRQVKALLHSYRFDAALALLTGVR